MSDDVAVIGAGLAGSECAWQLARRGHRVRLFEMRPKVGTAAHRTDRCAELVCSNSFRSDNPLNAVGLLKREMEVLDSLIIRCARAAALPAGDALAMDRTIFADLVTEAIASRPEIELVREEMRQVPPEGYVVIATGPLTSEALDHEIGRLLGTEDLYFYDSIAPVVVSSSLDFSRMYAMSAGCRRSAIRGGSSGDSCRAASCAARAPRARKGMIHPRSEAPPAT